MAMPETPLFSQTHSDERYRTLFNSIDEGFCVIEVLFDSQDRPCDYRFLETNPAFERHTGLVDATGKRIRELAPAHEEHWYKIYGDVALTGEPTRFMQEARALDRWYDVYAFRVDAPEQKHVAVLFNDISDRTRTERNARLLSEISHDLLHLGREEDLAPTVGPKIVAHFHASQCALVEVDRARHLALVKNSWHVPGIPGLAGEYRMEDFLIDDFWAQTLAGETVVMPDVSRDSRTTNARRFADLEIGSMLTVPLFRQGEWKHLFALYRRAPSPWRSDQLALAKDLASRCWARVESLRAELALRVSEERLRLILENAREYAIFAMDLERRITSWNAGAESLLGYTEAEIMGQCADLIFTPEDRQRAAPEREATTALRDGRAANERWHVRKDGTRFWGSGAMMAMHDPHSLPVGLIKIMRDQTEEQATKQALERSQNELRAALAATERARAESVAAGQAKDRFLAALSHELRTPLNPVLMISSEASADPSLPAQVRADFEIVRKNIELEARLIDDMLDVTRIAQGKLSMHESIVDVHQVVQEAVETVRAAAVDKEIHPTVHLQASRSHVLGDAARLQQIFLNLLNNAVKFTPRGGTLAVTSANEEGAHEITVRVSDNGMGLTPEELARVFQPFAQGSHAGRNGSVLYGGLGLGLAIVEEFTTRHGGRVAAISAGRGQGATFAIALPLARPTTASAEAEEMIEAVGPTPALRILLVEDHAHTRTTLQRILFRRNYEVSAAGSKSEAIAEAERQRFDLLVSDIGLPDGDGYELLEELRRTQPHLQGIALSGFGMEGDLQRSAVAGFAVHLVKPVSVEKLTAVIAQLQARPAS